MRPGVLSGLGWLLVVPALYVTAFQWVSLRKLRDAWRGPDALSGEIDQSLACDLVSDFIASSEFRRHVNCDGELVTLGEVARLSDVKVDWEHRTYCLARTPKWQVLRAVRSVPCFATPPPESWRAVESERERVISTSSTRVRERLQGIRAAMASDDRPSKCPPKVSGGVPVLEYELLQGGAGDPEWSFLSTPWLGEAAVPGGTKELGDAFDRWTGKAWVAVVTSQSRELARAGIALAPWKRGQLTGTLSLVDADAGELLCEVPFAFRSSQVLKPVPRPKTRSRSIIAPIFAPTLDVETADRIRDDFKANYEAELTGVLKDMTGHHVRPSMY